MNTETKKVLRWLIWFAFSVVSLANGKTDWGAWWAFISVPAFIINTYSAVRLTIWLLKNCD